MVKPGKVEKGIKGTGDYISCNLGSLLDESFRVHKLPHPVAGKCEYIPQNYEPEETFELKPSGPINTVLDHSEQQVAHSRDKQNMSNLMRYKTFRASMPLYCIDRHCPVNQGECCRKIKGL